MTNGELMERYLQRLGVRSPAAPSWPALCALVTTHLHAVPFENLNIVDGLRSELTTDAVLRQVVLQRRGGFCYELNEAFGALLTHLGFSVKRIEARVWIEPQRKFGPPFDHLALVITLPEGDFLTDVGFGDNNRTPMRLPQDVITDISGQYSLRQASDDLWLLARTDRPLYEMTLGAQPLSAFVPMHRYHQTSADSIFAKGLICTRATDRGRVTLTRDLLITVEDGLRTQTVSPDCDEILEQYFGIAKEAVTC
jgi:N-hydroxyarylamine O-acetyltransferase